MARAISKILFILGWYNFLAYLECVRSYAWSKGHSDPDLSSVPSLHSMTWCFWVFWNRMKSTYRRTGPVSSMKNKNYRGPFWYIGRQYHIDDTLKTVVDIYYLGLLQYAIYNEVKSFLKSDLNETRTSRYTKIWISGKSSFLV